jgi:hypothetical protein
VRSLSTKKGKAKPRSKMVIIAETTGPPQCPKCKKEMIDESGIDDNLKLVFDWYCADCDLYLSDCLVLTGESKVGGGK